jgi:hypothetical protein
MRRLRLLRTRDGQWLVNDMARPDLAGASDVDIGASPSTNALPIRRFRLAVGHSQDLLAAWVQFPSLTVGPAHQRYTRLSEHRYRYESLHSGYQAEITVQNDGIVVQYDNIWRLLRRRDSDAPGV